MALERFSFLFWFVSNGNCISHSKETAYEIMVQVCLMGVGGFGI
jgi:hypothetical protein